MPIINAIIGRTQAIALIAMSVINIILVCTLFYLLVPNLAVKRNVNETQRIVSSMISTSPVDMAVYWDIHLDTNSRSLSAFQTRNDSDRAPLMKYLEVAQKIKLTSSLATTEIRALLGGDVSCHETPAFASRNSEAAKQFFEVNKKAYVCVIPVQNAMHILTGQFNIGWREQPSEEDVNAAIVQAQGLLNSK